MTTAVLSTEKAVSLFVDAGSTPYHLFAKSDGSALHIAQQLKGGYVLVCYGAVDPDGQASLALDLSAFDEKDHGALKAQIGEVLTASSDAVVGRLAEVCRAFARSTGNL